MRPTSLLVATLILSFLATIIPFAAAASPPEENATIDANFQIFGANATTVTVTSTQITNFRLTVEPSTSNGYSYRVAGSLLLTNGAQPPNCAVSLPQGGTSGYIIAIRRSSDASLAGATTGAVAITDANCNFESPTITMLSGPTTEYARAEFSGTATLISSQSSILTIRVGVIPAGYSLTLRAVPNPVLVSTSFRLEGAIFLNSVPQGGRLIDFERSTTLDFASFTTIASAISNCQPQTCDGSYFTTRTESVAGTFYFRARFISETGVSVASPAIAVQVLSTVSATLTGFQAVPNPALEANAVTFFVDFTVNNQTNLQDFGPLTLWYVTPTPDVVFAGMTFRCLPQQCFYQADIASGFLAGTYDFKVNVTRTVTGLGTFSAESSTIALTVNLPSGPPGGPPWLGAVNSLIGNSTFAGIIIMFTALFVAKRAGLPTMILLIVSIFMMGVLAFIGLLPFELLYLLAAVAALSVGWFLRSVIFRGSGSEE